MLTAPLAPPPPAAGALATPRWKSAATFAAGVGAVAVFGKDEGVIFCPFRRCTGGYCPGCGGTRAAGRLFQGDLSGAWSAHPLVVLLAAQAVFLLGLTGLRKVRPEAVPLWLRLSRSQLTNRLLAINAVIGLVVWVTRLGAGTIPTPVTLQLPW